MLSSWFPNVNWEKMWEATVETLYMTGISAHRHLYSWYYFRFATIFNLKGKFVGK